MIIRKLKKSNTNKFIGVRWLGAYGKYDPKISASYEAKNKDFKSFEVFSKDKILESDIYVGSNIKAQVGLLIKSYDKARFYPCDAWTKENKKGYIAERYLPFCRDILYLKSFLEKFHSMQWNNTTREDYLKAGKYIEGTANNIEYSAVVVKENPTEKAMEIANIYSEIINIPIISLDEAMKM